MVVECGLGGTGTWDKAIKIIVHKMMLRPEAGELSRDTDLRLTSGFFLPSASPIKVIFTVITPLLAFYYSLLYLYAFLKP